MPTVLRLGSLRVVIYTNDHRPAHVHVIGQGHKAIFDLNCPDGLPSLRQNIGFPEHQVRDIRANLGKQLTKLCEAWREIHE